MNGVARQSRGGTPATRILVWCALVGVAAYEFQATVRLPRWLYISHVVSEDAFYYIVPALHYVQSGALALDGRNVTNGFHPLWMLYSLLAAGLSPERFGALYAVSIGGWVMALAGFTWLCRAPGMDTVRRLTLFAFLFLSPLGQFWLCGMETGAAFLVLSSLFVQVQRHGVRPPTARAILGLGCTCGLAVLVRTDFMLLMLVLAVLFAVAHWRTSDHGGRGAALRRTALLVGTMGAIVLPYLVWNLACFDMLLPISALSKRFYAQSVGQDGPAWLPVNLLGLAANFVELLGAPRTAATPLWPALLVVIAACGLWHLVRRARRESQPASILTIGVLALPVVHLLTYAHVLGHFARDAYINWYFAPEILVIAVLLAEGTAAIVARLPRHAVWRTAAVAVVLLPTAASGFSRHATLVARTDLGLWVRAALFTNQHTPPASRIGAFSAGTQAFLADDGRTVTNLDGLINTPQFYHEYLRTGRLGEYATREGLTYFSDAAADLVRSDLTWYGSRVARDRFDVLTQWEAFGNALYNIARLRAEPHPPAHAPTAFVYRRGLELGRYFVEDEGPSVEQPAEYDDTGALLFAAADARGTNAFGTFAVQRGHYRVVALLRAEASEDRGDAATPRLRVAFASWLDGVTYAERIIAGHELPPDGTWRELSLFADVPTASETAEIRVQKLAAGYTLHLAYVAYLRYPAPPPPADYTSLDPGSCRASEIHTTTPVGQTSGVPRQSRALRY